MSSPLATGEQGRDELRPESRPRRRTRPPGTPRPLGESTDEDRLLAAGCRVLNTGKEERLEVVSIREGRKTRWPFVIRPRYDTDGINGLILAGLDITEQHRTLPSRTCVSVSSS